MMLLTTSSRTTAVRYPSFIFDAAVDSFVSFLFFFSFFFRAVDTEASYPYTARDGTCHFTASNVGATVTGHVDVTKVSALFFKKIVVAHCLFFF